MFERYLKKSVFESLEDFKQNFEIIVPEQFNFNALKSRFEL